MFEARYETTLKLYPYARSDDQTSGERRRHPVIVVGGGPVGLATALDLGRRGTPVLLLDDHDGVGIGSRAICFARRTLDIADRLGCGQRMVDKGVVWSVGRVYHGSHEVFTFDLSPEPGQRNPAFVNLQQPYVERFLVERIHESIDEGAPIEIRGCNRVVHLAPVDDGTLVGVDTPDGPYELHADWLIACDGARSKVREQLGLGFEGRVFEDNFLIADVRMRAPFPSERWFWFDPPFEHAGRSALLHKQPDDIWRLDFQLGRDIDRVTELAPERVRARIEGMLGDDVDYEIVWTSIYTFQCRRMPRFRDGRVLFAGDSAHQVSPFGARGANSGIQDAENLAWKLDLVVRGHAPEALLDSYSIERTQAADENILASTRATDFLTSKNTASALFRDAVLTLSADYPFARPLINSGRLSVPSVYDDLPLNGPDALESGPTVSRVGAPCPDAPLGDGFLLERVPGTFVLLTIDAAAPARIEVDPLHLERVSLSSTDDPSGMLAARYLGDAAGAVYLLRPDQHVAARWPRYDEAALRAALDVATARIST